MGLMEDRQALISCKHNVEFETYIAERMPSTVEKKS